MNPDLPEVINPYTTRLDELELCTRAYNCLVRDDGMVMISELLAKNETELLRCPNFGKTSLAQVKEELARYGLTIGVMPPDRQPSDANFIMQDMT
jgi:DNA-directed RNA polymerase alpha subunit